MVDKRRRIASKPTTPPPAADAWVTGGGIDPEIPRINVQTSEHSDVEISKQLGVSTSKSKSSSAGYKRTTLYLTNELHRRLKKAGLHLELEMSDIAEQAIAEWLDKHSDI